MGGMSWNLDRDTFKPIGSFFYSDTFGAEQKIRRAVHGELQQDAQTARLGLHNWQHAATTT